MVIRRDKPVSIWAWAEAGEKIKVILDNREETATAEADRTWKVTFPVLSASIEPLQLTVKGNAKTLSLDNILVGDVWLLGGQSNMEFPISKVENGSLEIVSAKFSKIRILTIPFGQGPDPKRGFPRLSITGTPGLAVRWEISRPTATPISRSRPSAVMTGPWKPSHSPCLELNRPRNSNAHNGGSCWRPCAWRI